MVCRLLKRAGAEIRVIYLTYLMQKSNTFVSGVDLKISLFSFIFI